MKLTACHPELFSGPLNTKIREMLKQIQHNVKLSQFYIMAFTLLFFPPIISHAQNLTDSARIYYKKQEYKQVINFYEKILTEGQVSANLYYNLGNAYFKDNQIGKAIYNYELAKKLSPGDDDIKTNLRIANAKTIDKIEAKENFLAGAIKSGLYSMFSTNGWAWLSIIAVIFTLLCAIAFIISKSLLFKRICFWLGILGIIKFVFVFSVGFASLHNLNKKTQAIVTNQVVQVLSAPNESGKSKFSLHEGTKLTVLSTNEEWTSIQLANGNEGWIKTQELGLF
ncbi:MAG TPA: tetratricopeptide repeat protein [Bacteroidia bacterium]|jgi:tetratricopeptide (TPR) repeat protein|nr:tetratricopeptide repeat protein [Bacteroidia bacterium]